MPKWALKKVGLLTRELREKLNLQQLNTNQSGKKEQWQKEKPKEEATKKALP